MFERIISSVRRRMEHAGFARIAGIALGSLVAACGGGEIAADRSSLGGPHPAKKLIEFGWDRPTPDFIRRQIVTRPQLFDGLVFTLHTGPVVFTSKTYPATAFASDQEDLKALRATRLTDNFVLVWAAREGDWDWFNDSDWSASETNLRNILRTARTGDCAGVFFDTEPYTGYTWYYGEQPRRREKSFGDYARQLYGRGARFMRVVQEEMPRSKIIMSWGPATALPPRGLFRDLLTRRRYLEREGYGLLPAFVDGALAAAQPGTTLIDGHEAAYFFVTPNGFIDSLRRLRMSTPVDLDNRSQYRAHYRFANAVYVDWILNLGNDSTLFGYYLASAGDRLKLLEQNTYYALATSDEYAWVYSAHMNWWTDDVPDGAAEAIRDAKYKVDHGLPLGFDIAAAVAAAQAEYDRAARARK